MTSIEKHMVTNGVRKRRKDKPLPMELQTIPPQGKSFASNNGAFTSRCYGKAVMWKHLGTTPPSGPRTGRYVVRKWGGTRWARFRCYNDVIMAKAAQVWLRITGHESVVVDTQHSNLV